MLAVRGEVSKHVTTTGSDPTGLGRWNYDDVVNNGNEVRFASLCQCVKSKSALGTVCLQYRRNFLARKIDACPRKLFILNLKQFASDSISLGLDVILTIDANEHVVEGKLAKQLKNLGIIEAFCTEFNPEGVPAS